MQEIQVEDKQIKVVRNWLIYQLVWDIQVFLKFANFYWCFNQDFNKLATLLTVIQKTIGVELLVDNLGIIDEDTIIDEVGANGKVSKVKTWVNSWAKLFKSKNIIRLYYLAKSKLLLELSSRPSFLNPGGWLAFGKLRQAFMEASILIILF